MRHDIERSPDTPFLQSSGAECEPIHTGNALAHVAGHGRGTTGNQVAVFPRPNPHCAQGGNDAEVRRRNRIDCGLKQNACRHVGTDLTVRILIHRTDCLPTMNQSAKRIPRIAYGAGKLLGLLVLAYPCKGRFNFDGQVPQ